MIDQAFQTRMGRLGGFAMGAVYNELPEWMKTVVDPEDIGHLSAIGELNFLKGYVQGQAMKIDELEEQVKLARDYQREVDAQLLEKEAAVYNPDSPDSYMRGWQKSLVFGASAIRESK